MRPTSCCQLLVSPSPFARTTDSLGAQKKTKGAAGGSPSAITWRQGTDTVPTVFSTFLHRPSNPSGNRANGQRILRSPASSVRLMITASVEGLGPIDGGAHEFHEAEFDETSGWNTAFADQRCNDFGR